MIGKEPRGELGRYAFGYSDKKPGIVFWVILLVMILFVIYNFVTITEVEAAGADQTRIEAEARLVEHGVGRLFAIAAEERRDRERLTIIHPAPPRRAARTMPKTAMVIAVFAGLVALTYVAFLSVRRGQPEVHSKPEVAKRVGGS